MNQLIDNYTIELKEPPSQKGSELWTVYVDLENDIDEVFPYLNSEWENCIYNHELKELTLVGERRYIFRPNQVAISKIRDREEGSNVAADLVNNLNQIWRRHGEIKPNFEQRKRPSAIEVYKLLPKTNCKECGYPTCMAFANDLSAGRVELSQCPYLSKKEYQKNREELLKLL